MRRGLSLCGAPWATAGAHPAGGSRVPLELTRWSLPWVGPATVGAATLQAVKEPSNVVPGAGLEPARPRGPEDFKSSAYANFATPALNL